MLKIFSFALVMSVVFTCVAIFIAKKTKILDYPDSRKIHKDPTPLLGGLAVFCAFVMALLFNFHFSLELKGVVIASALVMLSGLIDDINDLSASIRLIAQILSSILVIFCGVKLRIFAPYMPYGNILDYVITVLWIVGITNAMNFMDGLDGLAAGISLICALTFFAIAVQTGQSYFAFLNIALAGACLGFLFFNFNPARIFLGDAGSSFLGFTLASLAVMGEWSHDKPIVALGIPVLVFSILIFDMVYISAARIIGGQVRTFKEWIEYVGRDHLHHRLMGLGFSKVHTVLIIYLINMIFAFGVIVLKKATTFQAVVLLLQGASIFSLVTILMIAGKARLERMTRLSGHKEAAV